MNPGNHYIIIMKAMARLNEVKPGVLSLKTVREPTIMSFDLTIIDKDMRKRFENEYGNATVPPSEFYVSFNTAYLDDDEVQPFDAHIGVSGKGLSTNDKAMLRIMWLILNGNKRWREMCFNDYPNLRDAA